MMTKFEKRVVAGIMAAMMCFSVVQLPMKSVKAEEAVQEVVTESVETGETEEVEGKFIPIPESVALDEVEQKQPKVVNVAVPKAVSGEVIEIREDDIYIAEPGNEISYKFVPSESGKYQLNSDVYVNFNVHDENGYQARMDTDFGNLKVSLEENKVYYIDFSVSKITKWNITKFEMVDIQEGTKYTTAQWLAPDYRFIPMESGKYEFIYDGNSKFSMCDENFRDMHTYGKILLEKDKVYYIHIKSDKDVEWSLEKTEIVQIETGTEYTKRKGQAVEYQFIPLESGKYQFYANGGTSYYLYDDKGENIGYGSDKNFLEQGKLYYVDVAVYSDALNWGICKVEETELKEGELYTVARRKYIEYKFVPKQTSDYILSFENAAQCKIYNSDWEVINNIWDTSQSDVRISLISGEIYYFEVNPKNESVTWKIEAVKTYEKYEYEIKDDGTVEIVDYFGEENSLSVPEIIEDKKVTSIGEGAFRNKSIENVVIPSSVTELQYNSFLLCSNLRNVEFASESQLKTIEGGAFRYCEKLQDIIIPNGVEKIGTGAFAGTGLVELEIPDSVTEIEDWIFSGCKMLQKVTLGKGLTEVSRHMFNGCEQMSDIEFPKEMLGTGITKIEYAAFRGCKSLQNLEIPDYVRRMSANSIEGTAWYQGQPDGAVYVGKMLYKYKGKIPQNTELKVNSGTKAIADLAFEGFYEAQSGLTGVILPNGLECIGKFAFYNCPSLKSVTIPASVTEIDMLAFGYVKAFYGDSDSEYYEVRNDYGIRAKKIEDFTIYGAAGSAAQKYAEENGFNFVAVAAQAKGDVNDDGSIDSADLRLVLRAVCGKTELTAEQQEAADVEGSDSVVDSQDMRKILQFICGKIEEL